MKNKGYTLIELLVVMSIMAIFMAIILPGFNRPRPEQILEQASLEVRNSILQARSLAMAPQKNSTADCYAAKVDTLGNINIYSYTDSTIGHCTMGTALNGYKNNLSSKIDYPITSFEVKFRVAENEITATSPNSLILETVDDSRKIEIKIDQKTGYVSMDPI